MVCRSMMWLLAAGLAGCATPPTHCLLGTQAPVTLLALYFGRDMPQGGRVGDAAWAGFVATALAPRFPDGFTVYDGNGSWRDPKTGLVSNEQTKIVQIAVPAANPGLASRLEAVMHAYRTAFRQQAVGIVTTQGCAAF